MQKAISVDLFCSHCNQETPHQASIVDGKLSSLLCLTCGVTTSVAMGSPSEPVIEPHPAIDLGPWQLGQGRFLPEGCILPPAGSPLRQAMAAVRMGRALREMDYRVIRLIAENESHVRLASMVKTSSGLPVLVDIGDHLELAGRLASSQADGVVFTCIDPVHAESLGEDLGGGFKGLIVIRTVGENITAHVHTAYTSIQALGRQGHRHLAVTPYVGDGAQFSMAARLLRDRICVPLRAEVPTFAEGQDPVIAHAATLAVYCAQPGLALAALPPLTEKNVVVYDVASEVLGQFSKEQVVDHDTLGALVYMASKALGRVVTKPVRMLQEMGSTPGIFARSLPGRLITKPQRVLGEIRRLLRKIG